MILCDSSSREAFSESANEIGESDSEDEDSVSDTVDNSQLSLIEEFAASVAPLNPQISSVLVSIKDHIVDGVTLKLQSMITHPCQYGTGQHPYSGSCSPISDLRGASSRRALVDSRRSRRARQRRVYEDDGNSSGRDSDDGQEINRRASVRRPEDPKSACPFVKGYPESEKLARLCYKTGWPTVHRVK